MKISIITVAFNAAPTIADTILSVSSQTHPEIEHIIIDGASTDGTKEIIARNNARISKFISEPDRGIYDAMNKGLGLATGDVIAFLNADDVYTHDFVIAQVAEAMATKRLDALFGDVVFYRANFPEKKIRRYRSDRFSPSRIGWGWMPAHPALFFHQRVFNRVGPFRTDFRIAGDFEFVARAFKSDQLHYLYLPEVLVKMRVGGISTKGIRNTMILNSEVIRACRENGIRTNWLKILFKYPAKLFEFIDFF